MNNDTAIGRLLLLNASFIKMNLPLVNKDSGMLEKVNDSKFFSGEEYYRYYMMTEEEPDEHDVVWAYEGTENTDDYQITFLNQVKNREKKTIFKCYPVSNSIIGRIHKGYRDTILRGDKEFFRFSKIHGKYAGFPPTTKKLISTDDAKSRWSFIFNHILGIESNTNTKRKIGSLFGGIQQLDLTQSHTVTLIKQYSKWLKNLE